MNFRFLNIPVQIHPSFWIFLLFFTNIYRNFSIESIILGGVLIFSLLVHEYGHALTAAHFGASPIITLEAFGGNAQYNSSGISPKQRFFITLNGPLFECLLIVLPYFLLESGNIENYYVRYTLYVTMRLNILWVILNLLPIAPLDGGHLLRYLLEKKLGQKGTRVSHMIGLACAVVAAPYLFFQDFFFFGFLLVIFGFQNFQQLQGFKIASGENNSFGNYVKGIEAINNNDHESAKALLKRLLRSKDRKIKNLAIESLAKIYVSENETQKAYDMLLNTDHPSFKEGKCLLCKLAFERKNYELIAHYSRDIYEIEPTQEIALLNSKAFACLNQPAYAGAWLETASLFETADKKSLQDILLHPIYDPVRDQTDFKQYAERIS